MALHDLGERDRAFEFFDRAWHERDSLVPMLGTMLLKGWLSPDERFGPMLKKLGLADVHP
jgi:hypothetical protein